MFQIYRNQNSFIFSVDHNDIFDRKFCIDPGNLLSIYIQSQTNHFRGFENQKFMFLE